MRVSKRSTALGVAAALAMGIGAASAKSSPFEFDLGGGVFTVSCDVSYSGTKPGGATIVLAPSFTGCLFFGFPTTVTLWGTPSLTAIGGPTGGWYTGDHVLPSGTEIQIEVPIAGCSISIVGSQTFSDGVGGQVVRARNTFGGIEFDLLANSVAFTASGCPFSSGTGGMTTVTPAFVSGVTVP